MLHKKIVFDIIIPALTVITAVYMTKRRTTQSHTALNGE